MYVCVQLYDCIVSSAGVQVSPDSLAVRLLRPAVAMAQEHLIQAAAASIPRIELQEMMQRAQLLAAPRQHQQQQDLQQVSCGQMRCITGKQCRGYD